MRRVGLTKSGYHGRPSLLQTIPPQHIISNHQPSSPETSTDMAPRKRTQQPSTKMTESVPSSLEDTQRNEKICPSGSKGENDGTTANPGASTGNQKNEELAAISDEIAQSHESGAESSSGSNKAAKRIRWAMPSTVRKTLGKVAKIVKPANKSPVAKNVITNVARDSESDSEPELVALADIFKIQDTTRGTELANDCMAPETSAPAASAGGESKLTKVQAQVNNTKEVEADTVSVRRSTRARNTSKEPEPAPSISPKRKSNDEPKATPSPKRQKQTQGKGASTQIGDAKRADGNARSTRSTTKAEDTIADPTPITARKRKSDSEPEASLSPKRQKPAQSKNMPAPKLPKNKKGTTLRSSKRNAPKNRGKDEVVSNSESDGDSDLPTLAEFMSTPHSFITRKSFSRSPEKKDDNGPTPASSQSKRSSISPSRAKSSKGVTEPLREKLNSRERPIPIKKTSFQTAKTDMFNTILPKSKTKITYGRQNVKQPKPAQAISKESSPERSTESEVEKKALPMDGFKDYGLTPECLAQFKASSDAFKAHEERMKELEVPEDDDPRNKGPICPICYKTIDPKVLAEAGKMKHRQMVAFCLAHRCKDALESWISRSYPTIEWQTLAARIEKHSEYCKAHLEGSGRDSYYRAIYDESIQNGKMRNTAQAMQCEELLQTPGYYGSRGGSFITMYLVDRFGPRGGDDIRKNAAKDTLIGARGHVTYCQYVLMPEVAARLVMEDMKCSIEKAREIMEESVEIGELLNESTDESQKFEDDIRFGGQHWTPKE